MPAQSEVQRKATAIALHEPEKLYKRNKGLKKMSEEQLREFAETKHTGLPEKKKPRKRTRVEQTPTGKLRKIPIKGKK